MTKIFKKRKKKISKGFTFCDRLIGASPCQPVTSATSPLNKSQCRVKRPNSAATKCLEKWGAKRTAPHFFSLSLGEGRISNCRGCISIKGGPGCLPPFTLIHQVPLAERGARSCIG